MALAGFDSDYYLAAKLAALQADSATAADWAGKTTDDLEAVLTSAGLTAESHYEAYGWSEGLAPNAYFDADEYLAAKADAMVAGGGYATRAAALEAFNAAWSFDPYQHYLQYGASEGLNPSNDFDASDYLAAKLAALQADEATAEEWADKTVDDLMDVLVAAGMTPLDHFVAYGEGEGLAAPAVPEDEQVDPVYVYDGDTFTLTTGDDTFIGTSADDYFDGTLKNSLQDDDVILDSTTTDADLLEATVTTNSVAARIQNVETINVEGLYVTTGMDLTNVSGTTTMEFSTGISGGTATVTNANSLNVSTLKAGDNISTFDITSLASGTRDTVTVDGGEATTVNITGVGTGADSYDLTVADGATVVLATVGANDAISITSAGGDLDLTGVAALEDLTITSASDLDVAVTTALAADTVVDTSANVTISGIAADLDDDGVTTSGSGTVTIEVTDDANAEDFKGSVVDIIEFSGAQTAGEFIINENAIANFSGSGSAEITIDNVDGDLDTNSTTGTLMVNVSNDMTLIQTGAEVDTLLIQATPDETTDTDSDENGTADTQITITTLETATSTFTETVVVQGSADLEITTWTNDATSSVLSASTMTGDLTIGTTSAAGTIIAGKGDDDITVGNVATTIEGRDGDDTLTGGTAADTIKGGAGDDTIAGGATAANTIDAGAGDDQVTATAADSITLGSGSDTVISAVDIDYTIADIDTTNDTIIVTGTAGGDVDLTDVTPTSGAYDIDGSATDEFTLTGSTATDISAFVQLGTSTAVFTANTAGAVVAGAKDDVIAVDGANTITTGAGNDAIIVATGETTATVDDFTTGSDVVVLLGAAADGDSIDLSSVTPASGTYTVSTNHAITLETGGTALTATDVTGIFQLGSSSVTFDLDNTSNAVGGISAEGGMLDDYVDLGTIGTTATVYNFSDDGGVDYISGIVANTALSEVSFTGLTGITGTGTAVAANASKIADAADGSVYVFADSTDGTGSEAITSFVVGKDDTGAADSSVTADTILADVAAFLDAALGSADGETYVAVINDTGAADANEAYAYLVTADADGIDADNIELIGVLNTTVGNAAVTATDIS